MFEVAYPSKLFFLNGPFREFTSLRFKDFCAILGLLEYELTNADPVECIYSVIVFFFLEKFNKKL
jgi:hypothetical protein